MAHGLVPVVSKLASGISEIVDQQCGVLVDPDDIDGYARGIVWLAKNPSAFAKMSEEAPERVLANYSVAAMTDRWLTLFNRLNKGGHKKWPDTFTVTGPVDNNSLWFREPMRTVRRLVRCCTPYPRRRHISAEGG
jgi:hypothetical protein